jgi:hypothetical protein
VTLANLSPAARELVEQRAKLAGISDNRIPRYPNTGSSPLSFVQEGVWLTTQLFKTTAVFNRCSAIRIRGALNTIALQRAITEIVRRHETLRTRVNNESGVPRMSVLPADVVPLPMTDLSDVAADARAMQLEEILNAEVRKSFDLDVGPWLRAGILRASEMENTLFITTHHIATDGWSDSVMLRELDLLYAAFLRDESSPLTDPVRQFRDFAQWQRQRSTEAEGFRDVEYWRERLADTPKSQDLPTDHPRPEIARMDGAQVSRVIPSDLSRSLAEIGRAERETPAMVAHAA